MMHGTTNIKLISLFLFTCHMTVCLLERTWKISDFHHGVAEVFALLGCYAVWTGNCKLWSLYFIFYRSKNGYI